jgi:pimeloyl-ACP methyl ester carboxylesterase
MAIAGNQTSSGTLDVGGAQLYYEVSGAGHPLVMSHAGIADHSMWDEQFAELAKQYRVVRYDTRGFGKTITEDVEFSNREDLRKLLYHLGIERTYLMGCSRGGQIATDFTIEFPQMVAALISVCGGLSGMNEVKLSEAEDRLFAEMEKAEEAEEWVRVADLDVAVWAVGPNRSPEQVDPQLRERVKQMCLTNYTTHKTHGKPQVLTPPAAPRLGQVNIPALIIIGEYDTSGAHAAADTLAAGIRGARKVLMRDTAHVPSMEKPQEFNRLVLDFLGGLTA